MCEVISVYLVSTCMPVSVNESTTYLELVKCISYSISNVCSGVKNTRTELIIIGLEKLDSQRYVYATLMHGCIIARSLANLVKAAKTSLCVASYLECMMCYCLCYVTLTIVQVTPATPSSNCASWRHFSTVPVATNNCHQ